MGTNTKIEWADSTWSPSMGCTPISEGCKNCYARRMMTRYKGQKGWPNSPGEVTLFPGRLEQPSCWRKPKRIFVCSMSDLFHDDVPFEFINSVIKTIAANQRHTFIMLTKRPKRMFKYFRNPELMLQIASAGSVRKPLPNLHLGVSVENQETADLRIPDLLKCPAAKRFVSIEPCLSGIDVSPYLACQSCGYTKRDMQLHGDHSLCKNPTPIIDQIIVGSETGTGARTMDLDWARSIRDQCIAANVPFFFKKDSKGSRELDRKRWEEQC